MKERLLYIIRELPVVLAFFVGAVYATNVLGRFSEDTTSIINVAVAITAALSGLCFAMASTSNLESEEKDRVSYAGERFFHASIFFLLATILKYSALSITSLELFSDKETLAIVITTPFHIFVNVMFLYAVFDSHSGIKIINNILWGRLHRLKEWDNLL